MAYELYAEDLMADGRLCIPWPGVPLGPATVELDGYPRSVTVTRSGDDYAIAELEATP